MERKCPVCGSRDVSAYLWSLPPYPEQVQKEIAERNVIVGGYCVAGFEPSAHCNACGADFGMPPYLRRQRGQPVDAPRELFPDVLTGIMFTEGGYFLGGYVIEITRNEKGAHFKYENHPGGGRFELPLSADIDLTEAQWKQLMDVLFDKLCVHEWKQRYFAPGVFDGTQWELELRMTGGRCYRIQGSNGFPALYKDLVRTLRSYLKS